ncbi:hypothetical protein FOA52_007624 [Chlamydomonas sp. UWO 241]|nr:hypothetical protein FOA52_007624 [Chlamydomonas sp. UWO 241]
MSPVPNIIWSFWDSPEPPELVKRCVASWREWHPTYAIRLLNRDTVKDWIRLPDLPFIDSPARYADVLRLALIREYGGWWMDASIFAYTTVDTLIKPAAAATAAATSWFPQWQPQPLDLVGYFIDNMTVDARYPMIENWMFGAPKGSRFVAQWCDEFMGIDDVDSYVTRTEQSGVDVSGIGGMKNYLAMHVAAQAVLQRREDGVGAFNMSLHSVFEGPFKYLGDAGWDTSAALALVCDDPDKKYKRTFLKLRGSDRYLIDTPEKIRCFTG